MFSGASAIAFDFDLSYDHDSPGMVSEAPFFVDGAITKITLIKFIKKPFIFPSDNIFIISNRDPPA